MKYVNFKYGNSKRLIKFVKELEIFMTYTNMLISEIITLYNNIVIYEVRNIVILK